MSSRKPTDAGSYDDTLAAPADDEIGSQDTMEAGGVGHRTDAPALQHVDDGRYQDGPEVARGGMGRIHSARDLRLRRSVAIKELLATDDSYHVRRFEREALITARLQHPAIVPVYDAGRWRSGEPFYSMKLVSGRPLDKIIARCSTLDERLALLPTVIAVAEAIAYAHSEGVIHRDLKPANVLVGSFGETVVIDWGLAKDLNADESESIPRLPSQPAATKDDGITIAGSVLGTPAYMPPEQAKGHRVDEKADVFALGAILYHLLSGSLAYDATTTQELIAQVTASRVVPITERVSDAPRELIAIVEHAMAAAPQDRYPSAKEFADELKRFQTGQLVGAHRYTTMELIKRWIRRHRAAVIVAFVLVSLLIAISIVAVQRVVSARNAADRARLVAEQRKAGAEQLVDYLVVNLRDELDSIGRLDVLSGVGARVKQYYAQLEHGIDAMNPADQQRWSDALEIIAEVQRDQGALDPSLATLEQAKSVALAALEADPGSSLWRHKLARTHIRIGRVLEAKGKARDAVAQYGQGLDSLRTLARDHWDNVAWQLDLADAHDRLGNVLRDRGELDSALAEFRSGIAVRDRLGNTNRDGLRDRLQFGQSASHVRVGTVLQAQGQLDLALKEYQDALDLQSRLVAAAPHNSRWQQALARSHQLVGSALRQRADLELALEHFQLALPIARRLSIQDPQNATWQRDLILIYQKLGVVLLAKGEIKGALENHHAALVIAERLVRIDPDNVSWQLDLSRAHNRVGDTHRRQRDLAAALGSYEAAKQIRARLAEADPSSAMWQRLLAWSHQKIGTAYLDRREFTRALDEMKTCRRIRETLVRRSPTHSDQRHELAAADIGVGRILLGQGKTDASLASLRRGIKTLEDLTRGNTDHAAWDNELAHAQIAVGDVLVSRQDPTGAREAYLKALALQERLTRRAPSNVGWQADLAETFLKLASASPGADDVPRWKTAARAILLKLKRRGKLPPGKQALLRQPG